MIVSLVVVAVPMIVETAMETSSHVNLAAVVLRALQRPKALKFAPNVPLVLSAQIAPSKHLAKIAILVLLAIAVKFVKNVVPRVIAHLIQSVPSVLHLRSGKRRPVNHVPAKRAHQLREIVVALKELLAQRRRLHECHWKSALR